MKSSVHSREEADESSSDINDWAQRLPSLCGQKGDSCRGGKKPNEHITILLCCSAMGEKLKPLVIGTSQNSRCFKGIDKA